MIIDKKQTTNILLAQINIICFFFYKYIFILILQIDPYVIFRQKQNEEALTMA